MDSDVDDNIYIDIETLSGEFCSFKKGFLLAKPPDRRDTKKPPERPAPKTQAKRTENADILQSIQYLRSTYGL
jgi:hypothetical protein